MASFGSSENAGNPSLCANNCGFYGTPRNQNLCSICYAALLEENSISISISAKTGEDSRQRQNVDDCSDFVQIHAQEPDLVTKPSSHLASKSPLTSESTGATNAAAGKNRCVLCNKKVGLLGFSCWCGGLFCGKHRYPEDHGCDVDLKAIGRERLAKQNVECRGNKLEYRV